MSQVEQPAGPCPGDDTIAALVGGALAGDRREGVAHHLDRCERCRALVAAAIGEPSSRSGGRLARGSAVDELAAGAEIGRYRIEAVLARGGMGVVYLAFDPELDRRVALKLMREEVCDGPIRLIAEARAMAQLDHPNVIAVHDAGSADGHVFVAMDLVSGTTLRGWLARPRGWREIVATFVAAGEGLLAAHRAGIVHRDFKPDNVLVDERGRVRVTDFGLARSGSPGPVDAADAAAPIAGTPAYMAPEQYARQPLDARTDQFSFCVALYEALWQTRPFAGGDPRALAAEVVAGRLRPPPRSSVPGGIRRAVLRGLARDPADRFPDLAQLLAALRAPAVGRRAALVAALAVLAVGGAALLATRGRAVISLCGGGEARAAAVWSDTRRAGVLAALRAASGGDPALSDRMVERIDRYAAGWATMYRRTCEATERGEQSAALFDRRMACLDQLLGELEITAALLGTPDPLVASYVGDALDSTRAIESCSAAEQLAPEFPMPVEPATAATVAELRRDLVRAAELYATADYPAAARELEAIAPRAERTGWKPIQAELAYYRGVVWSVSGRVAEAVAELERAAGLAEAGRHDSMAVAAWSHLVYIAGDQLADLAAGDRYAARTRAAVERIGGRGQTAAEAYHHLGVLALNAERYDVALADFRRSRSEMIALGDTAAATAPLEGMAMVFESQGEFERALAMHAEVRASRAVRLGADHPDTAIADNNVASSLLRLNRFPEALAAMDRVLAVRERALGPGHPDTIAARHNRGELLLELDRPAEALVEIDRATAAFARALGADHQDVWVGKINRSGALLALGRPREAIAQLEAVRAALSGDERTFDLVRVHVGLAESLRAVGQHRRALREDDEAERLLVASLGATTPFLAHPLAGRGIALVALGRYGEAIAPLERALELAERGGTGPKLVAAARSALDAARLRAR